MAVNMQTAQQYQAALLTLLDAYYDAYNNDSSDADNILAQYNEMAEEAIAKFPDAECYLIDPALWDNFHDFHKDVMGFRPRSGWTVSEVKDWFKNALSQQHQENA